MLAGIITFILVFGVIVVVHEFGHFYFAKRSGILVREFAVGMGPKIFSHMGKDGTMYTIRALPLGGYVRMAGWGDDKTEIKTGTPATLTLNEEGKVIRINLSDRRVDQKALPMQVTNFDFEEALFIKGLVLDEEKSYSVDHDATIVEEDGTEVRIAPLDVQYQNASIWGRMITNFAGPMNNFILGFFAFLLVIFLQGGVQDVNTNAVRIVENGPAAKSGLKDNDRILKINGKAVSTWEEITDTVEKETEGKNQPELTLTVDHGSKEEQVKVRPEKSDNRYVIGVQTAMKTGFTDKLLGGFTMTWEAMTRIFVALRNLIFHPDLNKLGGPVAIYKVSSQAASYGFVAVVSLLAFLSINIGIFNLIPIPALDGGKILINIIEAIRRKPLKQETETVVSLIGVAIMVLLMLAVTWNDIMRLFLK